MDKTAIKNFAIEARKTLMKSAVSRAGFYGITVDEIGAPIQRGADFEIYKTVAGTENRIFGKDIERRKNLVRAIEERGFDQVIEETAYTWFNRLIAIRFMEVNDYLPTRTRVLSSETGNRTPDIVSQYMDLEIGLSSTELEKVQTAVNENRYDDAFQLLFVKQCNALNEILPGLFEKTDDYMELLLDISYTGDGVVRSLVDGIDEANFDVSKEGQVEIIGWMYQYYNTELKDDTFAKLQKNIKISRERIPAATQLFTPDWIVRYMVENSVGRVWIEHLRAVNPTIDEKKKVEEFGWKYYLPEAEQDEDVTKQLGEVRKSYKDITPQDITCIDPCMGSGHILVYMFDVLMDIYISEGFSEKSAVYDILSKNIFGLDIDQRAYQLSYFALMMKGRSYGGRRFFRVQENRNGNYETVEPHVYTIVESNSINRTQFEFYGSDLDGLTRQKALKQLNEFLDSMNDAKEYGSILRVDNYDWYTLRLFVNNYNNEGQMSFESVGAYAQKKTLLRLISIGETLSAKYKVVVTNPPYMPVSNGSKKLIQYVEKNYASWKTDLYSVFICRCSDMLEKYGIKAMITMHSWLFLPTSEEARKESINEDVINMIHLGTRAFEEISGEVVQTVAFTKRRISVNRYKAKYRRLVDYTSSSKKEQAFLSGKDEYIQSISNIKRLPGLVHVYWASETVLKLFENCSMKEKYSVKSGLSTGENDLFIRHWYEVDKNSFTPFNKYQNSTLVKWVPYNKGGGIRKWYGINNLAVNWGEEGESIKRYGKGVFRNPGFYFREGITWSGIASSGGTFRYCRGGFIFDSNKGPMIFEKDVELEYALCLLNTKVTQYILPMLNPTISLQIGNVESVPVVIDNNRKQDVINYAKMNVRLSMEEWDAYELSWDFSEHPIVKWSYNLWDATAIGATMQQYYGKHMPFSCSLELCYLLWQGECNERFNQLKTNEEELNRIFIDIYGLQDELTPEVEDKDITVRKADLGRDIRSLISYAVGCMFGRYSLAQKGLVYAGGEFDNSKYGKFPVDEDAIIPITDEAYFDDDIVGRFEEFLSLVFGEADLENNLNFVAEALGTKGKTSREKIRNYFLTEFYKDHCNTYSVTGSGKRPIYWLFDSGKQNGFKALIYMHRYTPDTVGIIRSVYLKKAQDAIEKAMETAEYIMNSDTSAVDKANAKKKHDKYVKQLNEIRPYYQALTHVALQKIAIDLDDGVKHNYQLFQGVEISGEGTKNQKIDLLAKI